MLKKLKVMLLLSLALLTIPPKTGVVKAQTQNEWPDFIVDCSCASIMLATAYTFAQEYSDQKLPERILEQFSPSNIISSFCVNYADQFITTIGHECGHAFMAKLVNGDPLDINIGGLQKEPLISIGPFHLCGFHSNTGYALVTMPYKENFSPIDIVKKILTEETTDINKEETQQKKEYYSNTSLEALIEKVKQHPIKNAAIHKPKRAAILLAGGLAGILTHFTFKTVKTYLSNKQALQQDNSFISRLLSSALIALEPDSTYVGQLFNMLVPMNFNLNQKSDGRYLFEDVFNINSECTDTLNSISPLALVIAKIMITSKWHSSDPSHIIVDMPLALFNQLTDHLFEVYSA